MQIVSDTVDEECVDAITIIFGDTRLFRTGLNRQAELVG